MDYKTLQSRYDKIYLFLKNTCESFDEIELDGNTVNVILKNQTIESYKINKLQI